MKYRHIFRFYSAWLKDDISIILKLSKRVALLTGLSTTSKDANTHAEQLQVVLSWFLFESMNNTLFSILLLSRKEALATKRTVLIYQLSTSVIM